MKKLKNKMENQEGSTVQETPILIRVDEGLCQQLDLLSKSLTELELKLQGVHNYTSEATLEQPALNSGDKPNQLLDRLLNSVDKLVELNMMLNFSLKHLNRII